MKKILANTVYTGNTLKSLKKEYLIDYIRILEHNCASAEERLNNQAKNFEMLLKQSIKETTEKIMKIVFDLFPEDKQFTTISKATIYELSKQFGADIE